MNKPETLLSIIEELPPIMSRKRASELLGGAVSYKSLANADSLGNGPPRYKVGKTVVYVTKDLIAWIASRSERLK